MENFSRRNPLRAYQLFRIILTVLLSVPTALIYYFDFSLDHNLLTLASTLLFIAVISYTLTSLLRRLRHSFIRNLSAFSLFTVFALYLFMVLISYYLQGGYLNQRFFFHFRFSSITEAWGIARPLLILFFAWMGSLWVCLALGLKTLKQDMVSSSKPADFRPLAVSIGLLLIAPFLETDVRKAALIGGRALLTGNSMQLEMIEWDRLELNRLVLDNGSPAAKPGKNLLLIYLEGLEMIYMNEAVFPGLTPNLQRLNDSGWVQQDMQQVQGTEWTMAGIASSLCGTPLVYESSVTGNDVMFTRLLDQAHCLSDVLHSANYQQVFLGGASVEFAGKGHFLMQHQYDQVLGHNQLLPRLPSGTQENGWGLYDQSLFDLAADEYARLASMGDPFNLTLLTVDTHHPAGDPSPDCPRYSESDNSILQAVYCTDFLLNDFLGKIERLPGYEDTVVVLLSDHLSMRNDAYPLFPEGVKRRQYFNVLNVDTKDFANTNHVSTSMDVAPTLLDLLKVEHDTEFLAGSSLVQHSIADRAPVLQHTLRTSTISYLNSNFLTSKEGDLFFKLDQENFTHLILENQIVEPEFRDGRLEFTASGTDPYFLLPVLPIKEVAGEVEILIELQNAQDTDVAVFYTTQTQPEYSADRFVIRQIPAGTNSVYFKFAADLAIHQLRIDPGSYTGDYVITNLEVRH